MLQYGWQVAIYLFSKAGGVWEVSISILPVMNSDSLPEHQGGEEGKPLEI